MSGSYRNTTPAAHALADGRIIGGHEDVDLEDDAPGLDELIADGHVLRLSPNTPEEAINPAPSGREYRAAGKQQTSHTGVEDVPADQQAD